MSLHNIEYSTKYGILVDEEGDDNGSRFQIIDRNGYIDEHVQCFVDLSDPEEWTTIVSAEDGYQYILFFNANVANAHGFNVEILPENANSDTVVSNATPHVTSDGIVDETDGWTANNTRYLLSLYTQNIDLVRQRRIKTKQKMWEKIQEDFAKKGLSFTAKQIENRFKTLERRYKNYNDNKQATGRGRLPFDYVEEMNDIFKKDSKVFPQMLLSSKRTILKDELLKRYNLSTDTAASEQQINLNINTQEAVSNENIETHNASKSASGKTTSLKRRAVDVLQDLRKGSEKENQKKQARAEKKFSLLEERNKELKRKNDLFEKYLKLKFTNVETDSNE